MKKRFLALAFFICCLLAACGWWFGWGRHIHPMDRLVAESAALVLELPKAGLIFQPESDFEKALGQSANYRQMREQWKKLLHLASKAGADTAKIQSTRWWASVHTGNENKPEWVYYLPDFEFSPGNDAIEGIKVKGLQFTSRNYQGIMVLEWVPEKQGQGFTLAKTRDTWVMSANGYLIDEVIRESDKWRLSAGLVGMNSKEWDELSIDDKSIKWFLKTAQLGDWASYYFKKSLLPFFEAGQFPSHAAGKVFVDNGDLVLEGTTLEKEELPILPVSAVWSSAKFGKFLFSHKTIFLSDKVNPLVFPLFAKKQQEQPDATAVRFGTINTPRKPEKLVSITGSGVPALFQDLLKAHEKARFTDSLLYIQHQGHQIVQVPQSVWNVLSSGNRLPGISPCFATLVGEEMLVGAKQEWLSSWLDNLASATANLPDPATHSRVYFNLNLREGLFLLQEQLQGSLLPGWSENLPFMKQWSNAELEITGNQLKARFKAKTDTSENISIEPKAKVNVKGGVAQFWPFPANPSLEPSNWIVCQLVNNELVRIDPAGTILWNTSLPEQITSNLEALKLSKQGNTGILFSTGRLFQLRNELGAPMEGYPRILPDSVPVELVSAWDYEGNRDYRLVAISRYGDVFASGVSGEWLQGWNPLSPGEKLTFPPRHFRIGTRDFILLVLQNGQIEVRNRKGEIQPGFPVKLGNRLIGDYLLEPGLQPEQSYIYFLTFLGQVIKINLEGEVVSTQQLYRPERETQFRFCLDQDRASFCILRQVPGKITVFDQNYRTLFERNIENNQYIFQFFRLSSFGKYFVFTDQVKKETQLLDESGKPLFANPLPGRFKAGIIPLEDMSAYQLTTAVDSLVYLYNLRLP